jgi:phytoene/squalene synthetase
MSPADIGPYRAPDASHRYVLDLVRGADRDRFLAALFAPEPARTGLLALLAFDHELARTRTVTREPMLARIRLEWWREAVAEAAGSGSATRSTHRRVAERNRQAGTGSPSKSSGR